MGSSLDHHPAVRAALDRSPCFHTIEALREVTSTNDVVLDRIRAGAAPGIVVVADRQTEGRGRAGRRWIDVGGVEGPGSLAVTASAVTPPAASGLAPLAAGLAVLEAFSAAGGQGAVKWPNDVLLARPTDATPAAKAAGILVERHQVPDGPDVLLVGCGLDLDWRGVDRTDEAATWTSLAEAVGADIDGGQVLADLLDALGRWLTALPDAVDDLLDAYRAACTTLGRRVRAERSGAGPVEGVTTGIDGTGALVVDTAVGPVTVTAGDVHHLHPA